MEEIPEATHDAPAEGQAEAETQKSHHGGDAPQDDDHRPVCPVIGLA
jgi:hypothetical protein